MSAGATSLAVIIAIVALGATIGFMAGMRRKMDLEQWTVGGRGFGVVLLYLLMAGEVYTTFAFLGASGWAYSRGGPSLYILAYLTLAYIVAFFILPPIWEVGRKYGMQTVSDFFSVRYGSKYLAGFVCIVGIASFIPYLQLQLTGLGIIASIASFDSISRTAGMTISVCVLVAFVFASGVRAVAWVSVLKDILMVSAALAIGIGVPYIHFGGIGPMFAALAHSHPAHDDARRDHQPRPHVVHLHRSFDIARLLHVAACIWIDLYGEKRRHAAAQCRGHAPLHADARICVLRRLHGGAGIAGSAQRRSVPPDDRAPEFSALVSGRQRRWCPLPFSS